LWESPQGALPSSLPSSSVNKKVSAQFLDINMTTSVISEEQINDFDYVIVGGGTAGCVIASRLSEYLPDKKVLLIEAGPSDFNDDRVLKLKEWLTLLGGELDYDYGTIEQPYGRL
jgi:hypothetical protein